MVVKGREFEVFNSSFILIKSLAWPLLDLWMGRYHQKRHPPTSSWYRIHPHETFGSTLWHPLHSNPLYQLKIDIPQTIIDFESMHEAREKYISESYRK